MRYDNEALDRLMKQKRVKNRVLAELAGMHENNVRFIAHGWTEPRANTLAKLATALKVPVTEFFTKKDAAA
jgi:transcriptional regulator with XRE-family HTH domain